jgi:hypothetical protein
VRLLLVESALALALAGGTPTERRDVVAELFVVRRLLAGTANNVNQMAKATNATGEVQGEMVGTLHPAGCTRCVARPSPSTRLSMCT